ncbi:unnamed protein product [Lactuca saligna]|uniref:Uncharacterized protein n=1 Tax=Lactuca saligna TaxID=75948 RepID=A0AA36EHN8_LACSI|nr:unnamed protein product [Lactuca saligna]
MAGLIFDIEIRLVNEAHPSGTTTGGSTPWTLLGALPLDPAMGETPCNPTPRGATPGPRILEFTFYYYECAPHTSYLESHTHLCYQKSSFVLRFPVSISPHDFINCENFQFY